MEERKAFLQVRWPVWSLQTQTGTAASPGDCFPLLWKRGLKTPTLCRDSARSWGERTGTRKPWILATLQEMQPAREGQVRVFCSLLKSS